MAAAKHAVLHAANIDVWIRGADKVQGHLISSIVGTDHEIHFAWMRHHRFKTEVDMATQALIALKISNCLSLFGTRRLWYT